MYKACCTQFQIILNKKDVDSPEVTLDEQAAVSEVSRAPQAARHLSVLLHNLHHLTHGCMHAHAGANKHLQVTVTIQKATKDTKIDECCATIVKINFQAA